MDYKKGNPEYERYIHSSAWKKKADARMELDRHICCVCGKEATDVHHLTYDRFKNEELTDLVSLCRRCHQKAEDIYDPTVIPWAMDEKEEKKNSKREVETEEKKNSKREVEKEEKENNKREAETEEKENSKRETDKGERKNSEKIAEKRTEAAEGKNNFMAAIRVDAARIAPLVFEYIRAVRGSDFASLMSLRQPNDTDKKQYWSGLAKAVNALCRKRYSRNCVEDRADIALTAIENHVSVIALSQIEHDIRNAVQAELHEIAEVEYVVLEKWKAVAKALGITVGTLQTLRSDDGTSFGPSLREAVLFYCGLDAAAGIKPMPGFKCLTAEDYGRLTCFAEYAAGIK